MVGELAWYGACGAACGRSNAQAASVMENSKINCVRESIAYATPCRRQPGGPSVSVWAKTSSIGRGCLNHLKQPVGVAGSPDDFNARKNNFASVRFCFSAGRPKPRSLYKPMRLLTLRTARHGSWPSMNPQGLGLSQAAPRRRECHSSAAPRRCHVGPQAPPPHVRVRVGGRTGLPRATCAGRLGRGQSRCGICTGRSCQQG